MAHSDERLRAENAQLRTALANVYRELLGVPGEAAETVRAIIRKAFANDKGKARAMIRDALNAPRS